MALFLRGNIWWMEYRTRKVRAVKSTGLRREEKAKAEAVWQAWRLAFGAKPKRSIVEGLLDAVYARAEDRSGIPLVGLWRVYEDWLKGKSRVLAKLTLQKRRGVVDRFCAWADGKKVVSVSDVSVGLAREFVAWYSPGRANKSVRNAVSDLLTVWDALTQMDGSVHNPWRAALPDDDGSSVALSPFTFDEEDRVLKVAAEFGHGWWLASVISRWTGLRYGDVANLDWGDVDLEKKVIEVRPNKTKKHGVTVMVPMSDALFDAMNGVAPDRREGLILPEHAVAYPRGLKNELSFTRVLEAAGLNASRFTFHSWRHTFRTRLAEAGVSDDVARRLGGWTNLKMAAHYDHASHLDELRSAIGKMEGAR